MTKIKICGITNLSDALAAVELGVDALGFVFYKPSPRYVKPDTAQKIIAALPAFISMVGVFVDEESELINQITDYCKLDLAQLHGHESPVFCEQIKADTIKAIRIRDRLSLIDIDKYPVKAVLLDSYHKDKIGGTGEVFNWDLAIDAKKYAKIILAGGLDAHNIKQAIDTVRPYAVDVSSGIEQEPGKKDIKKMWAFIESIRRFDCSLCFGMSHAETNCSPLGVSG